MEGDPRNPRVSLLKKYDIPIDHLSYEYIEKCSAKKELERIIRILRSGEEGSYPDLLRVAEERLRLLAPDSRVLRVETPILTKELMTEEGWKAVQDELLTWENEMKVMDKSLDFEKSRIESIGNNNLPSIRKVIQPAPKSNDKNDKNSKSTINRKNERIKSSDYSAWDKFDVDKELLKIDVEEERKKEENEKKSRQMKKQLKTTPIEFVEPDKENYSSMEQQVLANQAKDRGNECFKSGDFESALKYYNISIKLYKTANALNNRAMTYLKLKQYENAIEDCEKVLEMEENNVKALHRKATAYQNLPSGNNNNNDMLALLDLHKIVLLEPNNKVVQAELQKLKKKLNIEDVGKKFRMPIFENKSSDMTEKISSSNIKDNSSFVEKLPLTYYGPSTSTFQCEPYSMAHHVLSGSTLSGEVLCKCNSNRPHQNPLCQKCGEKMCTPKPSVKLSAPKSKIEINSSTKQSNEVKNQMLKKQSDERQKIELQKGTKLKNLLESEVVKEKPVSIEKVNEEKLTEEKTNIKIRDECKNNMKISNEGGKIHSNENNHLSNDNNRNNNINNNNNNNEGMKNSELKTNKLEKSKIESNKVDEGVGIFESASGCSNDNSNEMLGLNKNKTKENISFETSTKVVNESKNNDLKEILNVELKKSQIENAASGNNKNFSNEINNIERDESKHSSRNSKHKKKKSKELKEILRTHIEPVKIVHAAKYLHPTSVEPKPVKSTQESQKETNTSTSCQFKHFSPNKNYPIADYDSPSSRNTLPLVAKKTSENKQNSLENIVRNNNEESFEGNKENLSVKKFEVNDRNNTNVDLKKNLVYSTFEFMKTWEELKKVDDSYSKRADIIRSIKPTDLDKVVGINFDSDMLSCFLECLKRHFVDDEPKVVAEFLKQLPQIPRFGLVKMFLADNDKKTMEKLIESTENKGFKLEDDVKKALIATS